MGALRRQRYNQVVEDGEHQAPTDQTSADALPLLGRIAILTICIIAGVILVVIAVNLILPILVDLGLVADHRTPPGAGHDHGNAVPGGDDAKSFALAAVIIAGAFVGLFAYSIIMRLIEWSRRRLSAGLPPLT